MLLHTYIPSFLFGRDQRRFHVTPMPSVRYHHVPMHLTQTRGVLLPASRPRLWVIEAKVQNSLSWLPERL